MKVNEHIPFFLSCAISIILLIVIFYLLFQPGPSPKEIIVPKVEYKDSPKIDSLKNIIDTMQAKVVVKKQIVYKYIKLVKDTIIRDSIFILVDDVFKAQDSIIQLKDSIIIDLTNSLKLTRDTAYYFQALYIDEKSKIRKWKRITVVSALLNGILLIK